jgi:hypothetical protein
LFRRYGIKVCLFTVAKAAERNPEVTRAFVEGGHEIVSHSYRWLDYQTMPEEVEREHIRLGIETIERVADMTLDDMAEILSWPVAELEPLRLSLWMQVWRVRGAARRKARPRS